MPDARAVSPVARQRRNLLRSPAFLVRPQLLARCSSLPTGRGFLGIVKLTAERKNTFHSVGISSGSTALTSYLGR
jgi:hypothetical protein